MKPSSARGVPRRKARSITFWIESPEALAYAAELAREMSDLFPRLDIVFVQPDGLARGHDFEAFRVPADASIARVLTRLRTHTLLIGGLPPARARILSDIAARRGAFQVLLASGDVTAYGPHLDAVVDPGTVPPRSGAAEVGPLLASSRRQRLREQGRVPVSMRLLRWVRDRVRPLWSLKFREYRSIDALRDALGAPQTLLCLGNGPSSQHPGLAAQAYDRLFRVNHSWMDRGGPFLAPDLVFTGQRDTVFRLRPSCGFVFGKIESEEKILGRLIGAWRRVCYATAQRLGVYATRGGASPTNGALMIATAVALRPRRLIVGGIDLFSDPAGAYPGDAVTQNAYALGHEATFELDFIVSALRRHAGELVVYGAPLRAALEKEGIRFQRDDRDP